MGLFGQSYPTLRQVIVNTRTDKAFRGLLWGRRGPYLVLRKAELLKGRGETMPMDGEIAIDDAVTIASRSASV